MEENFNAPVAINHNGKAIYFISKFDDNSQKYKYYYNVLNTNIFSENDSLDWEGYFELDFPEEISLAGYNMLRIKKELKTKQYFQAISDEKHVYFLRATEEALYFNRYLMVEVPNSNIQGNTHMELQPVWEVRYQRNGKPDIPYSDKDTQNFISLEGKPFIEPVFEFPIDLGKDDLKISDGGFTVNFIPTNVAEKYRWQIFITDIKSGYIHSYSIPRAENGWFDFTNKEFNKQTKSIKPDVKFILTKQKDELLVSGPPAAIVYTKQEPCVFSNNQILKLQRNYRLMFTVQVTSAKSNIGLATLDFAISSEGTLACLKPQNDLKKIEVGEVKPAEYVLRFNNNSWVTIPSKDNPIILDKEFTQQAWVFPNIDDLKRHTLFGADDKTEEKDLPPCVWISQKFCIEVGFGNGTKLLKRKTGNVLKNNAWNNIAVIFKDGIYRIYVNGFEVEHEGDDFVGQIPSKTPITSIGGHQGYFKGDIDEVRIWNGAQYEKIKKYLYSEIPSEDRSEEMQGYWKFDDGNGMIAKNISKKLSRDGVLSGPQWIVGTAPLEYESEPYVHFDDESLTLYAGVIIPEKNNLFSRFGNICNGSRPCLLSSLDGLVHLYYQGIDNEFIVAQYDTSSARATYSINWKSQSVKNEDTQVGKIMFSARQIGTVLNNSVISFEKNKQTSLFTAKLNDNKGGYEIWKGLSEKASYVTAVLAGQSVDDPLDYRLKTGEKVFYDYNGNRNLSFISLGDPLLHGELLFISRNINQYVFKEIDVTLQENTDLCSVKLVGNFVDNEKSDIFFKTLKNVPTDIYKFVDTINGIYSQYDYNDINNTNSDETKFYTIEAETSQIMVLIPDTNIVSMDMKVEDISDPNRCKVTVDLVLKNNEIVSEKWDNVPRKTKEFIKTIVESAKPAAKYLKFYALNQEVLVNSSPVVQANLQSICSFVDIFNLGVVGKVSNFTSVLNKVQGVESSKNNIVVNRGSSIFSVYVDYMPNNGYPALIDTTSEGKATSILLQPGQNGGWIAESPRYCIKVSKDRSGMKVPLNPILKKPLDINGSMTLESWINITPPEKGQLSSLSTFPRIIHCNTGSKSDSGKYMLGITYNNAMQFLSGTKIEITDANVNDNSLKLFNESNISSIQFYIKADLNTLIGEQRIFEKRSSSNEASLEKLTVNENGTLTYYITPILAGEKSVKRIFDNKLASQTWTLITIVRIKDEVKFYFNDKKDGEIKNSPLTTTNHSKISLGGNDQAQALEMEMNQFAIWNNRNLTDDDIKILFQKPLGVDDEKLVLLWGMDQARNDNKIINSAISTTNIYDSYVTGNFFWEYPGMFCRAFGAVKDTVVHTKESMISTNKWNHMALIYDCHYGIKLDGNDYADCGNKDVLNFQDEFSIEGWINQKVATPGLNQVLVSKYSTVLEKQSYEVGIDGTNKLYATVRLSGAKDKDGKAVEENKLYCTFRADETFLLDKAYFVSVTFKIQSVTNKIEGSNDKSETYSNVIANLYINGKLVNKLSSEKLYGEVSFNQSSTNVNLGRTKPDGDINEQSYFRGELSDFSLWNVERKADVIKQDFELRGKPKNTKGLVSYWNFKTQEGRVAFDTFSDNHAILNNSELWVTYHESSTYRMLINGVEVQTVKKPVYDFGGYEKEQLSFGSMRNKNNAFRNTFLGYIDEIRIWKSTRTNEQITDNMYGYLNGTEKELAAYWKFDVGSGNKIDDKTGNGNDAEFDAFTPDDYPVWVSSTAPINNEASEVLNSLGGLKTEFVKEIKQGVAVIEYADTELDSEGDKFSVLKRCYIYVSLKDGKIKEVTGYKVGDLSQVYLGQIQTRPSLIGYIEGAPPLPSENLTKPYYEDPNSYLSYYNNSSIKLTTTKSGKVSFTSSTNNDTHIDADFKSGLAVGTEITVGAGVEKEVTNIEGKAVIDTNVNLVAADDNGKGITSSITQSFSNYMYNHGDWEQPNSNGEYYLNSGERRFIPNNEGYALVKSSTADMYSLQIQGTGVLVGITIVPNTDIPEDTNIIYFPINPKYTKNGTLDGKLGLQNDPDYPDADANRGSYFKVIEAYNIKKKIEKKEREIMSSYAQFDAAKRGKAQNDDISSIINDNPLYNWNTDVAKKDMVNNYVWTAAGGLYSEQKGYVSTISEVQSGSYDCSEAIGASGDLKLLVGGVGSYNEASIMNGTKFVITVEKNKEEESALQLEVNSDPDSFLNKYLGQEQPKNGYYSQSQVPGKVDSYRFMTFYLAPQNDNFNEFFDNVVDPIWLNTSSDQRAAALREARSNTNPCWRVMHRVTYVSRIAPKFQASSVGSQVQKLEMPINIQANELILNMVADRLGDNKTPTSVEIGIAVRTVIMQDLRITIKWWSYYLEAAKIDNSAENITLNSLIQDTIKYINQYYTSKSESYFSR